MVAYLMKVSDDNELEVDIVNGEFGGIGVRYFNLDFSQIENNGETHYDYQIKLKEDIQIVGDKKIRLEVVLDDILTNIINESLRHMRELNV